MEYDVKSWWMRARGREMFGYKVITDHRPAPVSISNLYPPPLLFSLHPPNIQFTDRNCLARLWSVCLNHSHILKYKSRRVSANLELSWGRGKHSKTKYTCQETFCLKTPDPVMNIVRMSAGLLRSASETGFFLPQSARYSAGPAISETQKLWSFRFLPFTLHTALSPSDGK